MVCHANKSGRVEINLFIVTAVFSHSVNIVWSVRHHTTRGIRLKKPNHDIEGSPIVSAFSESGKFDLVTKQDYVSDHISSCFEPPLTPVSNSFYIVITGYDYQSQRI